MRYADGSISGIEHYLHGKKSGPAEYRYPNGQLKAQGEFVKGRFSGDWVWWR